MISYGALIDPPYNTWSAFEKYDDGLEHSIWLSLMRPRLILLNNLLSSAGVLWVSIDDNEVHYLKVLLDEVFGRTNFIACLPTIMNLKGNQDQFGFAGTHEYTLIYAKDRAIARLYEFGIDDDDLENWVVDEIGYFKKGAPLRSTGAESLREDRPYMFYPILIKGDTVSTITDDEYSSIYDKVSGAFDDQYLMALIKRYCDFGYEVVLPMVDNNTYGRWRWGFNAENKNRLSYDVLISRARGGISLYKKQRPELGELPSKKPKSVFYKPEYSSGNGTSQIKKLFGVNNFPYPKPEDLLKDFLLVSTVPGDLILDSFLGSGTSAAVAHKMGRKYIGIELGEHAKTHCVQRLQKVVDGTDLGGISKAVGWQGGGGFKFYTLAPSLLNKDKYDKWIISKEYNPDMLAAAMAKQSGFRYEPDGHVYWKQGRSSEKDYIYTTTQFMTVEMLEKIREEMGPDESLMICAKIYQRECENRFANITVKKIPQMLLGKCEFGKEDYSLNIVNLPHDDVAASSDDEAIDEITDENPGNEPASQSAQTNLFY